MSATATQGQAERAELEAVLNSKIFNRAPSLASFLKYVCQRHFDGQAEDLKEYSIAVEALGRPPDFDQKKDAIVRVEAHRLRKRLADYYGGPGADHTIHIEIPNGQYAPQFIYRDQSHSISTPVTVAVAKPESVSVPEAEPECEPAFSPERANDRGRKWILWVVLVAAASLLAAVFLGTTSKVATRPAREVWQGSLTEPVASEFRMLAGYHGAPFTDRQGRTWQPDAFYNGGTSITSAGNLFIEGTPDPGFGRSRREGDFAYSVPERPGTYEIHLYFADVESGPPDPSNVQLFRVSINSKIALDRYDLLSDAGAPNRLTSRVFRDITPAADGRIHLQFEQQGRKPVVSALEILWSRPGTIRPVRIVAAKQSVTDPNGAIWMADEYAVGGKFVERKSSIQDTELKPLFAGEHFGNFTYYIPVPPGKYRVRLFFAETFFGSKLPFAGSQQGPGARIFNVFCDGLTLLRNFDVTKEAGGPNRAVVKTFENLEPNAQGKIAMEFKPVRNYAEVNAIEVTQLDNYQSPATAKQP